MDIHYKVDFFTYWHCGSGLAAGADVDALVIKNADGLPYIPGKTIKGLIREAVEDLICFRYEDPSAADNNIGRLFIETFGYFDGLPSDDPTVRAEMIRGNAFFTNAELPRSEQEAIKAESLQPFLYNTLSNTAINANGIAEEHSLRRMEVAVPCVLEGEIIGLPDNDDFIKIIEDALRYVKRLGQNRNRGLGRCSFSIKEIKK